MLTLLHFGNKSQPKPDESVRGLTIIRIVHRSTQIGILVFTIVTSLPKLLSTSILTQLRTTHVPLNAFLSRIRRSDTALCPACRAAEEGLHRCLEDLVRSEPLFFREMVVTIHHIEPYFCPSHAVLCAPGGNDFWVGSEGVSITKRGFTA